MAGAVETSPIAVGRDAAEGDQGVGLSKRSHDHLGGRALDEYAGLAGIELAHLIIQRQATPSLEADPHSM